MADWKNPPRLFIPGPVKVNEDVLEQLSRPTLGHRGKEYSQLHGETNRDRFRTPKGGVFHQQAYGF